MHVGLGSLVYRVEVPNSAIITARDSVQPSSYSLTALGVVNPTKVVHEKLFEDVRTSGYSAKPSRLTSIFAFLDIGTAKRFRESGRMEAGGILTEHRITRLDKIHIGDMDLVNASANITGQWEMFKDKLPFSGLTPEEAQRKMVEAYWQSNRFHPESTMMELLIEGRLEFVRNIGS